MTRQTSTPAARAVFHAAQRDAERFHGALPAAPLRTAVRRRGPRLLVLCSAAVLSGALAAAALQPSSPTLTVPRPEAQPAASPWHGTATPAVPTPPTLPARLAVANRTPPEAEAVMRIESEGGLWHVELRNAPRWQVAQRLAALSGSELREQPFLLADTRALSLRWQGRDLAQLWPMMLDGQVNHALQCQAQRCSVWVLDGLHSAVAASVSGVAQPDVQTKSTQRLLNADPTRVPSMPEPVIPAFDGGSAQPMQLDPPGLFPDD
jgi:hypothetical protein